MQERRPKITNHMKRLLIVAIAIAITLNVTAQTTSTILPSGKNIPIRLTSEIRSNTKKRATVTPTAIVDADVKDADGKHILIRRGTPVEIAATIQRAKGVGVGAFIELDFISTQSIDGQTIRLQGNFIREGRNNKATALGVGLGVGLLVFPPCLFCLCIKGEKLVVPENTLVTNVVTNDIYRIDI